jgi:hypothetical protein
VGKSYKEKVNTRKNQEKHMTVEDIKKPNRTKSTYEGEEEEVRRIPIEREPSTTEITQREKDRGFKIGNSPKGIRTRYQEKREGEEFSRLELKSNATNNFIAHNINIGKWWNDPQIKKEDWKTTGKKLTDYILSNEQSTWQQLEKRKINEPVKAMSMIRRVIMQIN